MSKQRLKPLSVGNGLPTLMRQTPKEAIPMTEEQFRAEMLGYACGAGKALMELSVNPEGIKIEQEQVRKNAATILTILTETEDFLSTIKTSVPL